MLVKRIFNNNVLLAESNGQELVVVGRGVGFGQQIGNEVAANKVEKTYYPQDENWTPMFNEMIETISSDYVEVASHIISMAEKRLGGSFDGYLLIGLADHIQFAVERLQKKLPIKNELLWETRHFYPDEYELGQMAVNFIDERVKVKLPEDEVGFIALKFVEKRAGPNYNEKATNMTDLIEGALTLIRHELLPAIDSSNLNYQRLIVHLRFFVERLLDDQHNQSNVNHFDDVMAQHLSDNLQKKYTASYQCAQDVINYFEKQTNRSTGVNEQIYLTMHLQRIVDSSS
ncbi:transcriptional antiterminator [Leuconostoc litchii]|uniref:PRD domain-containing protein n=1 Tax=Leuconostoc litchii TaxID=1981069 RepID=A0A6P2CMA9_9LACO|nr:PRD domain-containing protein [Leuconostoc litchii]TYC47090.1 PRD domain-containing protein [Leuconostoc litchii]GMA69031.1 transcriptional antiterminator [Leuconostoc litchii]